MRYIAEDATLRFKFNTRRFSTGAPYTLAGTPSLSVYPEDSATQITAGITLTADYDSVTGLNDVVIDLSASASYAAGKKYEVVIEAGTVDSVSVVGEVVYEFYIHASGGLETLITRGMLALPNAAADAAGGLPISDAGGLDLDTLNTNVSAVLADTGTDGVVVAAASKTGYTISGTITTLDALDTAQDSQHSTTQSAVATAQADLDTITGTDGVTLATTQGNYAPAKAGDNMGTVSAVTGGINTGAGTITTLDGLDTAQDTQHATTQGKVDTAQADLDLLTGADGATLATSQPNYAPATAAALSTAQTAITAIKAVTDALTSAAAAKLATSAGTIITGTVSNAVLTPTTTAFAADDITEATADHYNGRIIIFTSGALVGQATDITDYSLVSSEGNFTVTALTEAPANDDTFVII